MTPAKKAELRRGTAARLAQCVTLARLLLDQNRQYRRMLRQHPETHGRWADGDEAVRSAIVELRRAQYAYDAAQPDHRNERALQMLDDARLEPPDCNLCGDSGFLEVADFGADSGHRSFPCPNGCYDRVRAS